MKKQEARIRFLSERKMLSDERKQIYTKAIADQVIRHISIPKGSRALSYVPIAEKAELDPAPIHTYLAEKFDAKIAFPKVEGNDFNALAVDQNFQTIKSKWGIAEPAHGETIAPELFSLVITPLVIFDVLGNRVGYGKGMYDRFFARLSGDCIRLGCCFFPPIDRVEDASSLDVPLSVGISPWKTYFFKS